jgi:hypothetical protein
VERRHLKWGEILIFLLGLLLFAGQAFFSSPQKSASFDEEYHVAAGYAYLKTGDFRMNQDHPPLINALSAMPLLFRQDVYLPLESAAWQQGDFFNFARIFLWESQENPQSILEWARWPTIILGTVLVAVLFWWARQMAGVWAGWIALILAVFDPNLIANARLVTTDLGVTCFLLLTMWRLWHWQQRPSPPNALLTGIFAGLSMTAKYTGLMVWPMVLGVILLWPGDDWRRGEGKLILRTLISSIILMGLAACMVVWAVYRFDVSPFPGTNIPFPASFYPYRVWQTFRVIEDEPLASFLLGQVSRGGWWYYFPVTLALKTSLPLLILGVVGLGTAVKAEGWRTASILWLPPLFYLLVAMAGNITIGYRHILPLVPFLIMLAAQTGRLVAIPRQPDDTQTSRPSLLVHLLLVTLLLWQIAGTLRLFPHQEAFFNELAGGPAGGGRVLADSNLDWGQDLIALRELMVEMGIEEVNLAYFGTAVPEQYGLHYQPLPGFLRFTAGAEINAYNPYTPPPGWYAIGQTPLHLGLMLQNNDIYTYFQEQEPQARAGYSINLYRVEYPADMPVDRVVITGTTVSDLTPDELGMRDGRRLITKWTANEATIIIPFTEPFSPPDNFQPVSANLADVMTLAGYTLSMPSAGPGEPVELALFWKRGTAPVPMPSPTRGAPLAAFVHLSGADPAQIVAQYDGWDTAVSTLEPGDVIIQHITLIPAPQTPPGDYFLRVGLYSPQTGQRFPLVDGSADFVLLTSLPLR